MPRILTINPGSTSTKVGLFDEHTVLFTQTIQHEKSMLLRFERAMDQLKFRQDAVATCLAEHNAPLSSIDAIVGRGGLLRPIPGGVYAITQDLLDDLACAKYGEHPSNLGAFLAHHLSEQTGKPAFIVDPVVTDEMRLLSRVTGLAGLQRRSVFHALSHRAAARQAATRLSITYEEGKFVVVHMGGGVSLAAHDHGRVVDVVNALDGEGPFSPERTGALPLLPLLDRLEAGQFTIPELRKIVLTQGGLTSHLGTNDLREVERRIEAGDQHAPIVFKALCLNIAKYAASLLPSLYVDNVAQADAFVLTGGMAGSINLTNCLTDLLAPTSTVLVVPDLGELRAMAEGGFMALHGDVEVQLYAHTPRVHCDDFL
ncbi:butyrate kinase [Desulfovibrio inopinatus]|uniref:butyrate kinase n=1 Tax=Desulfovibrio inopinatus TaxID=102109 RepID=UPI0004198868|nr:butyrate kinase [Desulfovibrio inopinatus]